MPDTAPVACTMVGLIFFAGYFSYILMRVPRHWGVPYKERLSRYITDGSVHGCAVEILNALFSVASCVIFVMETYSWSASYYFIVRAFSAELAFNGFFVCNYALCLFLARDKRWHLVSLQAIVDVVTVVPSYAVLPLENDWQASRGVFYRIYKGLKVTRIIRVARLLRAITYFSGRPTLAFDRPRQILALRAQFIRRGLQTLVGIFILAGMTNFLVEVQGADWGTGHGRMPFHDALYYIVVSFSTVGYGDITPSTALSRLVIAGIILSIFFCAPLITNALINLTRLTPKHRGRLGKSLGTGHIVLGCDSSCLRVVTVLLRELLAPDSMAFHTAHIVIMVPQEPTLAWQALLCLQPSQAVTYLNGDFSTAEDLRRARVGHARACFVLSDRLARDTTAQDKTALVRALCAYQVSSPECPVLCLVAHSESKRQLVQLGLPASWVVCYDHVMEVLVSNACLHPGFSTVWANALSSMPEATHLLQVKEAQRGMLRGEHATAVFETEMEYLRSLQRVLIRFHLGAAFAKEHIGDIAIELYRECGCTLIALVASAKRFNQGKGSSGNCNDGVKPMAGCYRKRKAEGVGCDTGSWRERRRPWVHPAFETIVREDDLGVFVGDNHKAADRLARYCASRISTKVRGGQTTIFNTNTQAPHKASSCVQPSPTSSRRTELRHPDSNADVLRAEANHRGTKDTAHDSWAGGHGVVGAKESVSRENEHHRLVEVKRSGGGKLPLSTEEFHEVPASVGSIPAEGARETEGHLGSDKESGQLATTGKGLAEAHEGKRPFNERTRGTQGTVRRNTGTEDGAVLTQVLVIAQSLSSSLGVIAALSDSSSRRLWSSTPASSPSSSSSSSSSPSSERPDTRIPVDERPTVTVLCPPFSSWDSAAEEKRAAQQLAARQRPPVRVHKSAPDRRGLLGCGVDRVDLVCIVSSRSPDRQVGDETQHQGSVDGIDSAAGAFGHGNGGREGSDRWAMSAVVDVLCLVPVSTRVVVRFDDAASAEQHQVISLQARHQNTRREQADDCRRGLVAASGSPNQDEADGSMNRSNLWENLREDSGCGEWESGDSSEEYDYDSEDSSGSRGRPQSHESQAGFVDDRLLHQVRSHDRVAKGQGDEEKIVEAEESGETDGASGYFQDMQGGALPGFEGFFATMSGYAAGDVVVGNAAELLLLQAMLADDVQTLLSGVMRRVRRVPIEALWPDTSADEQCRESIRPATYGEAYRSLLQDRDLLTFGLHRAPISRPKHDEIDAVSERKGMNGPSRSGSKRKIWRVDPAEGEGSTSAAGATSGTEFEEGTISGTGKVGKRRDFLSGSRFVSIACPSSNFPLRDGDCFFVLRRLGGRARRRRRSQRPMEGGKPQVAAFAPQQQEVSRPATAVMSENISTDAVEAERSLGGSNSPRVGLDLGALEVSSDDRHQRRAEDGPPTERKLRALSADDAAHRDTPNGASASNYSDAASGSLKLVANRPADENSNSPSADVIAHEDQTACTTRETRHASFPQDEILKSFSKIVEKEDRNSIELVQWALRLVVRNSPHRVTCDDVCGNDSTKSLGSQNSNNEKDKMVLRRRVISAANRAAAEIASTTTLPVDRPKNESIEGTGATVDIRKRASGCGEKAAAEKGAPSRSAGDSVGSGENTTSAAGAREASRRMPLPPQLRMLECEKCGRRFWSDGSPRNVAQNDGVDHDYLPIILGCGHVACLDCLLYPSDCTGRGDRAGAGLTRSSSAARMCPKCSSSINVMLPLVCAVDIIEQVDERRVAQTNQV